jgi:hypothetical protein
MVEKPYTVRLSGVISDAPFLHAQEVAPLIKLSGDRSVIWFAEKSLAGRLSLGHCLRRIIFARHADQQ